jgi:hypothetical protein
MFEHYCFPDLAHNANQLLTSQQGRRPPATFRLEYRIWWRFPELRSSPVRELFSRRGEWRSSLMIVLLAVHMSIRNGAARVAVIVYSQSNYPVLWADMTCGRLCWAESVHPPPSGRIVAQHSACHCRIVKQMCTVCDARRCEIFMGDSDRC